MKKLIISTIVAIALVGVVVFLFLRDTSEVPIVSPYPTPPTEEVQTPSPIPTPTPAALKVTVTYSDSGYSPAAITVKRGGTIIFDNKSSRIMWSASAVHPAHKVYPGSGIEKCGTSEQASIFDACKGYGFGESWEFKFNEQGTWKYHNHLQSSHTGTIIVE